MEKTDKEIAEKIMRFLDFVKKECPGCYKKMKKCCSDSEEK